jgi:hypothetical protein
MQQSKLMLRCNMYISFAALHKLFHAQYAAFKA